jgi:hypothetical protein
MSSVTFRGLAGESAFRVPFIGDAATDFTVTAGGSPAAFTFANGVVTLSAPLVADADVVVSDVRTDARLPATDVRLRGAIPVGYQQITSLSAAAALTVPAGATFAIIDTESQGVRWRDDGTDPTSTVGKPLPATDGVDLFYDGDLSRIKFIEQAASAKLNVAYYRYA